MPTKRKILSMIISFCLVITGLCQPGDSTRAKAESTETSPARYTVSVTNPLSESHITYSTAVGNGAEKQTVDSGNEISQIVYTADADYYFPTVYCVAAYEDSTDLAGAPLQNGVEYKGITVTRDRASRVTISGIPAGDVNITLTAAKKNSRNTINRDSSLKSRTTDCTDVPPSELKAGEGYELLCTSDDMVYRRQLAADSWTQWSECDSGRTDVGQPGTYAVCYK